MIRSRKILEYRSHYKLSTHGPEIRKDGLAGLALSHLRSNPNIDIPEQDLEALKEIQYPRKPLDTLVNAVNHWTEDEILTSFRNDQTFYRYEPA